VKVNYTGSAETFSEVVKGCPVPVVIAGGEKTESDEDIFKMVEGALSAGAAGVSIGRNAFQHEDPTRMVRAITAMVHKHVSIKEAMEILRG
jgi:DhnA family fructose-bisphosphate aldolase class Ia